jgi:hypothetical protein
MATFIRVSLDGTCSSADASGASAVDVDRSQPGSIAAAPAAAIAFKNARRIMKGSIVTFVTPLQFGPLQTSSYNLAGHPPGLRSHGLQTVSKPVSDCPFASISYRELGRMGSFTRHIARAQDRAESAGRMQAHTCRLRYLPVRAATA